MQPKTPKAIEHGHEQLFEEIKEVIAIGGKIGETANSLNKNMAPHFKKEEEYALPPLGLLLALSEGRWELSKNEAIRMADKLESKLAEMTAEHREIERYLQDLKKAAEEEDNIHALLFVKNLTLHIELEDQVLYPATILVGNYLKHNFK